MKIIDILNKIANNEQPPKKIVFRDEVYEYDETDGDYRNKNYEAIFDYHEITDILNEEVEILEIKLTWKQDTEIKKLYHCYIGQDKNEVEELIIKQINYMVDKINEIVEAINER